MIVAIDGPAGAGKSTVAMGVARRLDWRYLDTGAMYRALTWKALDQNIDLGDPDALVALARDSRLEFFNSDVYVDGRKVTDEIRSVWVGGAVSIVSRVPGVREVMVEHQRRLASAAGDMVVEGRDIGTAVFPDAAVKVFLTAKREVRARRRVEQLEAKGQRIEKLVVEQELAARDELDSTRLASPLSRAPDALLIDTSGDSADEVIELVVKLVRERQCSVG